MNSNIVRRNVTAAWVVMLAFALGFVPGISLAAPPVAKTVPWVASNPLVPHVSYSGKTIRLKGTSDVQGANIQYAWDFGDGTPVATGTVTNKYAIEASHAYSAPPGTVFTARLTLNNTTTGESASRAYFVEVRDRTLAVEADIAIDEGLWYLHKTQRRFTSGLDLGDWTSCPSGSCYATLNYYGLSAANVNAFEVNGHLEGGSADNPYTETVARGLQRLFQLLTASAIGNQTNGLGTFNPDADGNGIGVWVNQSYPFYQGGMFIDAIVASGAPDALAKTGPASVIGRSYRDIVQDMVDYYGYCQYDGAAGGGWRYNCNEFPDNSSAQWGAIGLIAAERNFGATIPAIVKNWNRYWLNTTQNAAGYFGYTGTSPVWGPYATTPSGMVQMAMDGIGRDSIEGPNDPNWNRAETFIRDNFANGGAATTNLKAYYYGLFSFTKSMLLHDSNGDGVAEPIKLLRSSTPGVLPIDWYAAELAKGDPTDGVARTLINGQNAGGYWVGHDYDGTQYAFETAWAIMMLNRTVFTSGAPVAVGKALPNPGVVGQVILLDGSESFHQDAGKAIVFWEWDLDNDGVYDATGPFVGHAFSALGDYPVTLRVCDNAAPAVCATAVVTVVITIPPIVPTANAGGPYAFCTNAQPWFLDARGSINPDEGRSEPGRPGDTIMSYAWELDGNAVFDDAAGPTPDVTAFFTGLGPGAYLVQLRVTDSTATSFPSSGFPNLSDTDSTVVFVRSANDPACSCVSNLAARAKNGKLQLTWTARAGADHYNVYRGTISGGPNLKIAATTSTYATYLDGAVVNGTTYYYVVREANVIDTELCQSNQASAKATPR